MTPMDNTEFQEHTLQIEQLVERVNQLKDATARSTSLELLQSLMDLHGAALARLVEVLSSSGDAGRSSLTKLGSDPLLCGLMVLYGVHPLTLEERVARAIEKIGPHLRKQNGSAELISINENVVRLKIENSGHGCGSSSEGLKDAVKQAILEAAPEVVEIVFEGVSPAPSFVPISMIQPVAQEETYEESAA